MKRNTKHDMYTGSCNTLVKVTADRLLFHHGVASDASELSVSDGNVTKERALLVSCHRNITSL